MSARIFAVLCAVCALAAIHFEVLSLGVGIIVAAAFLGFALFSKNQIKFIDEKKVDIVEDRQKYEEELRENEKIMRNDDPPDVDDVRDKLDDIRAGRR